jgi:hypothetical protein
MQIYSPDLKRSKNRLRKFALRQFYQASLRQIVHFEPKQGLKRWRSNKLNSNFGIDQLSKTNQYASQYASTRSY